MMDLFGILTLENVNAISHVIFGEYLDNVNCKCIKD